MIKAKRQHALALTQDILHRYWRGDRALLEKHLHPNVLWIGSMDSEYIHGRDAVLARFAENQQAMPPVFLDQEEFELVEDDRLTCTVVGRYRAFTDPKSDLLLSEKQRVTFLWRNEGGEMLIMHIHLSNVLRIQNEDERFPTAAGKINHDYLQQLVREHTLGKALTVSGVGCVTYRVNFTDVVCVLADKNYTVLRRLSPAEPIRMRQPFSSFTAQLPSYFYRFSRSAAVNLRLVDHLSGGVLHMADGTSLTVPTARRAALQARMVMPDVCIPDA